MTAKTDLPPILPVLTGVALIDAPTAAATGGMSVSWWHEEVRAGRAPAAAVRQPRCTRWRLADVADFWRAFATDGADDIKAAARMTAQGKKASNAARLKRQRTSDAVGA